MRASVSHSFVLRLSLQLLQQSPLLTIRLAAVVALAGVIVVAVAGEGAGEGAVVVPLVAKAAKSARTALCVVAGVRAARGLLAVEEDVAVVAVTVVMRVVAPLAASLTGMTAQAAGKTLCWEGEWGVFCPWSVHWNDAVHCKVLVFAAQVLCIDV